MCFPATRHFAICNRLISGNTYHFPSVIVCYAVCPDSDTDEETDRLLQEQYRPLNSRHLMNELVDGDDKELQQRKVGTSLK